jgi:Tfp pilus assembly protein PilP
MRTNSHTKSAVHAPAKKAAPLWHRAGGFVALLVMIALATSGCELLGLDGSEDTVQQADEDQKKDKADRDQAPAPTADKEEAEEYERPEYPGQLRRNPFLPDLQVIEPRQQMAEGDARPLEPLEQYGLGELALVAIISEVAVPKAMFIDPEGFGHVVKEGDRVGQNGGTITDIRDNEVEVREVTDEEETETRMTTVELREPSFGQEREDGLSDEERDALRRLLQSEEGQRTLKELGSSPGDQQQRSGGASNDRRFGGVAPPEQ